MPSKPPIEKRDPFRTDRDSNSYIVGKLVGGNIPLPLAGYLHLLAAYYELSIQGVLQKIIKEWCEEKEPVNGILEILTDRAFMEWTRRISSGCDSSGISQTKFLEEIKLYLSKHKVNNKDYVERILVSLKQKMQLTL